MRGVHHTVGLVALVMALLGPASSASAASCSQQDRLDRLIAFSDGWTHGDLSTMKLDRPDALGPFGLALPRRSPRWPRELQGPRTWQLARVRAWLRRRVAAGDRVTILRARLVIHQGMTGGVLSYRRTAPDVRGGHKVYGVAKFEVRCGGLTTFGSSRSWWTWTAPIGICHPGKLIGGIRFCGRLP